VLIGWRLAPARKRLGNEGFDTGVYITEARVPDKSKAVGMTLCEIEGEFDEADAQVIGLVHNEMRMNAPNPTWSVKADDILIIERELRIPDRRKALLASVILLARLVLFVTEWGRMDVVALMVLSNLALLRLVSPGKTFSGFSNPVVIVVWTMFIMNERLTH
jgi:hypothetical protein